MISAARRLGGSAARRLGGSAARRLGGSAARRLGSGDGFDQLDLTAKGLDLGVDLVAEALFHGPAGVDAVEHGPGEEGMVVAEAAGQRLSQECFLAAHRAQCQLRRVSRGRVRR
jgi:hypothetical protein